MTTEIKLSIPVNMEIEDQTRKVNLNPAVEGMDVLTIHMHMLSERGLRFYAFKAKNVVALTYLGFSDTVKIIKMPCTKECAVANYVKNKVKIVEYLDKVKPKWRTLGETVVIDTDRISTLSANDFVYVLPLFLAMEDTFLAVKMSTDYEIDMSTIYCLFTPSEGDNGTWRGTLIALARIYFSLYMTTPNQTRMWPDAGKKLAYGLIMSHFDRNGYTKYNDILEERFTPSLNSPCVNPYGLKTFKFDNLDNIATNIKQTAKEPLGDVISLSELLAIGVDTLLKDWPTGKSSKVSIDMLGDTFQEILIEKGSVWVQPVNKSTTMDELRTLLDTDLIVMVQAGEVIDPKDKEVQNDIDSGFEEPGFGYG